MIVTVEISHYPLTEHYEEDIISLIDSIKKHHGLTIKTTPMSTYVKGESSIVFRVIEQSLSSIFKRGNLSSTILKIIPKDLPVEDGYLDF